MPKTLVKQSPGDVIRAILTEHPNINGMQIKTFAKGRIGKNKIDTALKEGQWERRLGNGNQILYSLAALARSPEVPAPIEQGNQGNHPAPAEVVA